MNNDKKSSFNISGNIAEIKQDIDSLSEEARTQYVKGLRDGIYICEFLLPKDHSESLAKDDRLRDLLDFIELK